MNVGIVGLGKIGAAVARRLKNASYSVWGFDLNKTLCTSLATDGIFCTSSLQELAQKARIICIYVPAGAPVEQTIAQLKPHLQRDDILIDGGNSKFTDSQAHAQRLAADGIFFLDCGTSGGIAGESLGFSLMVGGDKQAYERVLPLLDAIAMPGGIGYVGPSGAGHYVKMVHNGIEYALLQAYAEGIHLLKDGAFKDAHLDLEEITRIWINGSIIRSWILELLHTVIQKNGTLENISGQIGENGTGTWTVEEAHKNHIPLALIETALAIRAQSRKTGGTYATKLVALLRHEFGGHPIEHTNVKEQT